MSFFADQKESQMRHEMLIAAILALSQVAASSSFAQDRPGGIPHFTAEETRTVSRNEVLQALIETDPWLVRDFLDAVAQRQAANTAAGKGDDPATAHSDAASVEWLDLLRQLRDEKAKGDQEGGTRQEGTGPSATNRSAAGSLELLDTLKRARKDKDAAK